MHSFARIRLLKIHKYKKEILRIVEEPRDLAVDLKCFVPAYTHLTCHVRKANSSDFGKLVSFVSEEFGERWLHSIEIRISYI